MYFWDKSVFTDILNHRNKSSKMCCLNSLLIKSNFLWHLKKFLLSLQKHKVTLKTSPRRQSISEKSYSNKMNFWESSVFTDILNHRNKSSKMCFLNSLLIKSNFLWHLKKFLLSLQKHKVTLKTSPRRQSISEKSYSNKMNFCFPTFYHWNVTSKKCPN